MTLPYQTHWIPLSTCLPTVPAFSFLDTVASLEDSIRFITMADYLIVGGGLAGCVLASRLKEYKPSLSTTVIETSPNEHDHPLITEPMSTIQLHNSPFEYKLKTVPQKHYDGREVFQAGGRLLSGSSSVYEALLSHQSQPSFSETVF